MTKRRAFAFALLLGFAFIGIQVYEFIRDFVDPGSRQLLSWWQGNEATRVALVISERAACGGAPFVLPADGFIGLLYGDPRGPYSPSRPHQGIDIFSDGDPGTVPVYAAYDGYVTREDSWRSTLIQRVPNDPLQPGRQIWLYYTHMADRQGNDFIDDAFPPGTREVFVRRGTRLGFTGNYNGDSARTVWTHLHFSVVRDDGNGSYANELEFDNTLDPSPYLGRAVNYGCEPAPDRCGETPICG